MRLTDTMIRLAWSRPKSRKVLLPMVKVASQGLSTLDVRIFDFVRNQFLEELTTCFVESFDYKTTITRKDVGYIEGKRGHFMWKLKFEIIHRGDTYEIETTLHAGTSFQDAKFVKFETGQQESLEDLFQKINDALAQMIR